MAVYVDDLRKTPPKFRPAKWRYDQACHMMADTEDELEAMARRLQLRKTWRHGDHYDLTAEKRRQALAAGALSITIRAATLRRG